VQIVDASQGVDDVPVSGSNRTGIFMVQVKGTPMLTNGGPGGFCLSISRQG
jgi:hypothetical protein